MDTKLKRDIIIWHWNVDGEFWQRIHLPDESDDKPLLLALKDEHNRAILLPTDQPCTETWLQSTPWPSRTQIRGA